MEDRIYLTMLYDIYGDLLTEKERKYFEAYYFDNLSLGEISENMDVSRNAVHKSIKLVIEKLNEFESKLHLKEKNEILSKIINSINDEELKEKLNEISW
ncbi:MAG: sigma factor-like helix-turn-helix DNA-binding protein [Bacilli bacterium]|mgnify:FL=1